MNIIDAIKEAIEAEKRQLNVNMLASQAKWERESELLKPAIAILNKLAEAYPSHVTLSANGSSARLSISNVRFEIYSSILIRNGSEISIFKIEETTYWEWSGESSEKETEFVSDSDMIEYITGIATKRIAAAQFAEERRNIKKPENGA